MTKDNQKPPPPSNSVKDRKKMRKTNTKRIISFQKLVPIPSPIFLSTFDLNQL